jgi:hypothetical protein
MEKFPKSIWRVLYIYEYPFPRDLTLSSEEWEGNNALCIMAYGNNGIWK